MCIISVFASSLCSNVSTSCANVQCLYLTRVHRAYVHRSHFESKLTRFLNVNCLIYFEQNSKQNTRTFVSVFTNSCLRERATRKMLREYSYCIHMYFKCMTCYHENESDANFMLHFTLDDSVIVAQMKLQKKKNSHAHKLIQ